MLLIGQSTFITKVGMTWCITNQYHQIENMQILSSKEIVPFVQIMG